jgi:primosomal protein N' (replication factor Y)
VRVLTDVVAVDREFDYEVPAAWHRDGRASRLHVGTMVRVALKGRRVGAWVTACDPESESVELQPLARLVGAGPPPEVLRLADWAARRWAGRRAAFYRTASPPRVVEAQPRRDDHPIPPAVPTAAPGAGPDTTWEAAFEQAVSLVRVPPAGDRGPLLAAALRRGGVLLVVPQVADAARLAGWVRRRGVAAALLPQEWERAAAGGVVVGTRAAVFAPMRSLAAVVVLDEHDEALASEDSPTWSAREIAVERARRAGAPCVLVSPIPTLEAQELADGDPITLPRHIEREGWPHIEIVDQRDPEVGRHGLLTETLVARLRSCGRAVCVLNRKGRARLLACAGCGNLVVCDACGAAAAEGAAGGLDCLRCGEQRPLVCSGCGAVRLKTLRPGVARLREELEVLLGEPVAEVSGPARLGPSGEPEARVVIGTEAALHRGGAADLVAFLDFDQELSAVRYRANEQAMALLARAARLVGPRSAGGRILVQTRQPHHSAVEAARAADPGLLSSHDRDLRQQLGFPPFGALAEIAKSAAPAFIERFGRPLGVDIADVGEGRWILRAADRDRLLDTLAAVDRPPGHLRLAIDPLRL